MSESKLYFFNSLPQLYEALRKEHQEQKIWDLVSDFLKTSFSEDFPEKVERFLRDESLRFNLTVA